MASWAGSPYTGSQTGWTMPKADTVAVPSLSREQAIAAADWLEKDYQPGTARDVAAAQELAEILAKAARRKRQGS